MEAEPDRDRLNWMYRQMLRIREFEERVKSTFTVDGGDPVLVCDAVGAAVGWVRHFEY
jgi:TPP-dependent pyruvate/acetoin dehydrogenase alpha subunit